MPKGSVQRVDEGAAGGSGTGLSVTSLGSSRDERVGRVQTVCGAIAPEMLGKTLLHEHVLLDIRPPPWRSLEQIGDSITLENRFAIDYGEVIAPGNCVLDKVDVAVSELAALKASGGDTLVELSCGGLHPDPAGLRAVSLASGVNIVMGCGYYVEEYQSQEVMSRCIDALAAEMVEQVLVGAWGTDVRAGIIGEIGCQSPWSLSEQKVMAAAVVAQQETGASLTVHPGRDPDQPQEVADFLKRAGARLDRSVISHIDRTIFDNERLFRLADTGVVIEFDLFGMETSYYKLNEAVDMPNDAQRLKMIRALIDRGHLDQVAMSQDICFRSRLGCHGGHGYGHMFRNVIPLMRRRQFDEAEIEAIFQKTPARLLAFI